MTPPAKRTGKHLPSHITGDKLPSGVNYDPRGNGRWEYRKGNGRKDRGKRVRFGSNTTTLAEIWSFVETLSTDHADTLRGISLAFQDSSEWKRLKPRTQNGYTHLHRSICERETRTGTKLGDMPLEAWTPGAVRRYRESRRLVSESAAAAEIRYIKRVFSWAIEYEHFFNENPAKGVSLRGLSKPRTHYVQETDYCIAVAVAPLTIGLAAHLAYLTGRRRTDILKAKRSDITADGLTFTESKTGKETIVEWSDELRSTIEMITKEAGDSIWLFPRKGSIGEPMAGSAFDTAWQRVRGRMKAEGYVPFQFKDIRAKHASDFDEAGGDSTENLGHSDKSVTRKHYLRKPKKVVPLR